MLRYNEMLPPLLFGEELKKQLTVLPEYDDSIRELPADARLIKLMDIYKLFAPQNMAAEIYHKLYMMCSMSLNQKGSRESVKNANGIYQWQGKGEYHGIITGMTSSTIIGTSGIGKTSCIQRGMQLIGGKLETEDRIIIPAIMVTCPFDCNYKGLLSQILIAIDEAVGTDYYEKAIKQRMNSQQMMSMACQASQLYVGVLIIDEIQFLRGHKSGKQLYQMIMQLINAAGISVLLVGTEECIDYLEQAPQIARRTAGLRYGTLEYDTEFRELTQTVFLYQYTKHKTELSEGLLMWLYEHSGGNTSALVSLIYGAQEIAIIEGIEEINVKTLTKAYTKRMQSMRYYIENKKEIRLAPAKKSKNISDEIEIQKKVIPKKLKSIVEISEVLKQTGKDAVIGIREYYMVEEAQI